MPRLAQATTVPFLHPDPVDPVHEYDSIQYIHDPSGATTVSIELSKDAYPVSEHGVSNLPITTGREALIPNSAGESLVDGHVGHIHQDHSTTVYTVHR